MDLLRPNIFGGKRKEKNLPWRTALGIDYSIRVQNCRVYLLKTAWTLGLLCGNGYIVCMVTINYLVSVYVQHWAMNTTVLNVGPTQSDLRIFARNVL